MQQDDSVRQRQQEPEEEGRGPQRKVVAPGPVAIPDSPPAFLRGTVNRLSSFA